MAPRFYRAGVDVKGPSGVGRTAVGMARLRAAEGLRSDKLFDDPYAAAFVAAAPLALPAGDRAAEGTLRAAFSSRLRVSRIRSIAIEADQGSGCTPDESHPRTVSGTHLTIRSPLTRVVRPVLLLGRAPTGKRLVNDRPRHKIRDGECGPSGIR